MHLSTISWGSVACADNKSCCRIMCVCLETNVSLWMFPSESLPQPTGYIFLEGLTEFTGNDWLLTEVHEKRRNTGMVSKHSSELQNRWDIFYQSVWFTSRESVFSLHVSILQCPTTLYQTSRCIRITNNVEGHIHRYSVQLATSFLLKKPSRPYRISNVLVPHSSNYRSHWATYVIFPDEITLKGGVW